MVAGKRRCARMEAGAAPFGKRNLQIRCAVVPECEGRWRLDEIDHAWVDVGRPVNRLFKRGLVGPGDEIANPNVCAIRPLMPQWL